MRQKTHLGKTVHSRNLAIAFEEDPKSTKDVRNFNIRSSQVIKEGKVGFNQSLTFKNRASYI
jgi:hypothetical protein